MGVLALMGVKIGCLAGSSTWTIPLGCLTTSDLVSFFSSSFFPVGRVSEEEAPVEDFLGLLTGGV